MLPSTAIILAVLYIIYRLVDPLPPRHLAIAAGTAGSVYDNFARQYARILAHDGVELEVRNSAGAVENLDLLRDAASGVQAALTTFGFTRDSGSFLVAAIRNWCVVRAGSKPPFFGNPFDAMALETG